MSAGEIVRLSPTIRRAAQEKLAPVHPEDDRLRGVSHIMWCENARGELLPERLFQRRFVLDKRDGHIGPESPDRFEGVEVAGGRDDLRHSEILGDLNADGPLCRSRH
jgi:hypothetical protein